MANINKRMKQNIKNAKLSRADELTLLETQEKEAKRKERTRYILMMIVYAAVYFGITYFTKEFAYEPHQFRIAEAMIALVFFDPAAFPGVSIGCFAANIIGPGTFYDAVLGTAATGFGIYAMKWWSERNGKPYIGMALYAFLNAFMIALEFSYNANYASQTMLELFAWVMLGEVVCGVLGGTILHFIVGKRWKDIVSETKKGQEEEYHPTTLQ